MDLDDEELKATKENRKDKVIKELKAEIEEGTYCITLYGSDKEVISQIIKENEEMKGKFNNLDKKIKRLENIIDYDRSYEWEKEIYCLEVLKQIRGE